MKICSVIRQPVVDFTEKDIKYFRYRRLGPGQLGTAV